jgi:hypothetical protein
VNQTLTTTTKMDSKEYAALSGNIKKKKNMYRHPMKFYKVVPALLYGSEKR